MNSNGSPVSSSSYTQQSSPVFPLHNNISTLPVQRCRSHKQRPISFPILTASREPFPSYSFTNAAISSRRPSIHGPGNEKGKAKGQEARSRSPRPRGGFRPRSIHAWKEKRIQGATVVSALERKRERGGRIEGCLPSIQWLDAATLRLVDSPLTEFSPKSLGKSPPGCDLHCLHRGICTFVSERTNKQIFSPVP